MSRETYCPDLEGTFRPGVFQGLLWQHLPTVGQFFATFGDFWRLLATFGNFWQQMGTCGNLW